MADSPNGTAPVPTAPASATARATHDHGRNPRSPSPPSPIFGSSSEPRPISAPSFSLLLSSPLPQTAPAVLPLLASSCPRQKLTPLLASFTCVGHRVSSSLPRPPCNASSTARTASSRSSNAPTRPSSGNPFPPDGASAAIFLT